ncbi:MAG: hypothetical protein ACJ8HI_09495 [Massilia sp.]
MNPLSPRCTAVLLALSLCACASQERQAELANGSSVRATLASQIAHPEAVRNTNPVSGMDGAAALQAQQKYEKSFSRDNVGQEGSTSLLKGR